MAAGKAGTYAGWINDDGDVMCCETCSGVFHAACLGLPAPPAGTFFCPLCTCSVCGDGGNEGVMPTGCQWVDCRGFRGTEALQSMWPYIGPPADMGSQGPSSAAPLAGAAPLAADAAAVKTEPEGVVQASGVVGAAETEAMQVDAATGPVAQAAAGASAAAGAGGPAADFSQLVAAATAQWQATHAPAGAAQEAAARISEGARVWSGECGGANARAPLPLSLLVVNGAAAAAQGDCCGYAPAYSPLQRQQLQVALCAALQLLHSCYAPIWDSGDGPGVLPWLLRGSVMAGRQADSSGMHTALIYAGSAVVAVATFRSFGEFAELPVLAVRPELQRRNGLGRLLLAAVEQLLLQAGSQVARQRGASQRGASFRHEVLCWAV
ncbi:hypothetical protein ABPG77_002086 [Micractinium sp. CCAP 211/92]